MCMLVDSVAGSVSFIQPVDLDWSSLALSATAKYATLVKEKL